jgi:hypothetical protein
MTGTPASADPPGRSFSGLVAPSPRIRTVDKIYESDLLGRLDYLDRPGRRLIVGGMIMTIPPQINLAGISEGAVVRLRYQEGVGYRTVLEITRVGRRPGA